MSGDIVMQHSDIPVAGSGSFPTSPHQFHVSVCTVEIVQPFIEEWHYSHSIFGVTVTTCFKVTAPDNSLAGAAIFGLPAMMGSLRKYSDNGKYRLLELRRFCMIDATPKNTESRVLGVMFRMLKRMGYCRILSYADPSFGHAGTIYKATGFDYLGTTSKRIHYMWNGRKYPARNADQIKFPYHKILREAISSGEASKITTPGKHIYLKTL